MHAIIHHDHATAVAVLAACRHAVGLNQAQLAERIGFSRSTIANVETGRQHAPREFWQSADTAVSAGGSLLAAHDDLEATASQARAQSIQMTRAQPPIALPVISAAGHPLWGASASTTSTQCAIESDVVATAAAQARDYAANTAVTGIGPGTVEQLTAEVVRLGRAYVAGSPLPLFTAMHQTLRRVQDALRSVWDFARKEWPFGQFG